VIADGIIAVEGDGRLNGMQKALHTFLLAADPAAADAELTRLLGLSRPSRIRHRSSPAGNGVDAVLDAGDLCGGEGRGPNIRVVAEDDVEVAACRAHNHDRSHIIYSCYTKAA
jgi:uncharacterized protein (DUF362 family)